MWGSIWGWICLILFIYLFSEFVCGLLLSHFFLIVLVLLNWGLLNYLLLLFFFMVIGLKF
jgi:hypothetical protein